MKKPKKNKKYEVDGFIFNTLQEVKQYVWYQTPQKSVKTSYELCEDVITKRYIIRKLERRLICEKIYDSEEEELKNWRQKQLNLW